MRNVTKHLGEMLIEEKKLTPEHLKEALQAQQISKERLGHTLINLGYISEDDLIKILELQFGIPCIKINNKIINWRVVKLIPEYVCRKYRLIPILLENDNLTVAVTDPFDLSFIDEIKFATAYNVEVMLCSEKSVMDAIDLSYGISNKKIMETGSKGLLENEISADKEHKGIPIQRIIELMLAQAEKLKAKEIQIDYISGELHVFYISQQRVIRGESPPSKLFPDISERIKTMAMLDPKVKTFQEGLIRINLADHKKMYRVFIFPVPNGENIFIRTG